MHPASHAIDHRPRIWIVVMWSRVHAFSSCTKLFQLCVLWIEDGETEVKKIGLENGCSSEILRCWEPEYSGTIDAHSEIQLVQRYVRSPLTTAAGKKENPETGTSFLLPQQHVLTLKPSGRITILACENLTG